MHAFILQNLIVLLQVVDALHVCTERDTIFMKSDFATGDSVKVFDAL